MADLAIDHHWVDSGYAFGYWKKEVDAGTALEKFGLTGIPGVSITVGATPNYNTLLHIVHISVS